MEEEEEEEAAKDSASCRGEEDPTATDTDTLVQDEEEEEEEAAAMEIGGGMGGCNEPTLLPTDTAAAPSVWTQVATAAAAGGGGEEEAAAADESVRANPMLSTHNARPSLVMRRNATVSSLPCASSLLREQTRALSSGCTKSAMFRPIKSSTLIINDIQQSAETVKPSPESETVNRKNRNNTDRST